MEWRRSRMLCSHAPPSSCRCAPSGPSLTPAISLKTLSPACPPHSKASTDCKSCEYYWFKCFEFHRRSLVCHDCFLMLFDSLKEFEAQQATDHQSVDHRWMDFARYPVRTRTLPAAFTCISHGSDLSENAFTMDSGLSFSALTLLRSLLASSAFAELFLPTLIPGTSLIITSRASLVHFFRIS
jgi:hypothetical protein